MKFNDPFILCNKIVDFDFIEFMIKVMSFFLRKKSTNCTFKWDHAVCLVKTIRP